MAQWLIYHSKTNQCNPPYQQTEMKKPHAHLKDAEKDNDNI